MKKENFMQETLNLEDIIQTYDNDALRDFLPQIQTADDIAKSLVHEHTSENMPTVDAQIHHQIDPSYQ